MKRRAWLWAAAALCALTLVLAFLARPEDELAGIRALHPRVRPSPFPSDSPYAGMEFVFTQSSDPR